MVALLILFSCVALVCGQTSLLVRWNDAFFADDDRELIYRDEIVMTESPNSDGPGILLCRISPRTSSSAAGWRRPDDAAIATGNINNDFTQYITSFGSSGSSSSATRIQLARARDPPQDGASNNGLWTCNGGGILPPRHVPLYNRGNGAIIIDSLSLGTSSSFSSSSPRFTLIADTSGGPPTTSSWRNDAGTISNGGSNSISIEVNPNNDVTGRMNSHYRSTLEVTAVAPGTYTYFADNRATSGDARMSFVVEGGSPSNLRVMQTGLNMVELTWDAPPGPPAQGYQVQYGNMMMTAPSTSLAIDTLSPGDHSFQVTSPSQHFPGSIVGPVTFTVRGTPYTPEITIDVLTARSVRVSYSPPPMLSFIVIGYRVTVVRLTACNTFLMSRGPRTNTANERDELFEELEEYIDYRARVNVSFQSPSSSFTIPPVIAEMDFITPSALPSATPSNMRISTTSRTANVSWNAIDCRHQNGPNFHYVVELQRMDGGPSRTATINGAVGSTVNDEVFVVVEDLRPFTDYNVQVRGVNSEGSGGSTSAMMIQTNEDTPGNVANLSRLFISFSSVSISWSAPEEPNGRITGYELTFALNDTTSMSQNFSDPRNFTVSSDLGTEVEVRVRAYTSVGPGLYATIVVTLSPPTVMNVGVESLPDTSVRVTWDAISIPGITITEYVVYYAPSSSRKRQDNEQRVRVSGDKTSVDIRGLESTVEYQYQVAAVAMLGGKTLEGTRSPVSVFRLSPSEDGEACRDCDVAVAISVSVVVTFLLTIILYSALLLIGYYIARAHRSKPSKKISAGGMAMKENAAYGTVISSQQPQDYILYAQPSAKQ